MRSKQNSGRPVRQVSFIIPAWNEEAVLGRTLDALQAAVAGLAQPHEIIVVDDASTDGTAQVAEARGARVLRVNHRQIAAVRNAGAAAATGDVFIFIDADTVVHAALIQATVQAIERGAVGGCCLVDFDGPMPWYVRAMVPPSHVVRRIIRIAYGCYVFATREAFEAVHGFDLKLFAGEEVFFSQALKRVGRFVVLKQVAITSGRKLRTHTTREIWGTLTRLAFGGRAFMSDRRRLGLWYAERRPDDGGSQ